MREILALYMRISLEDKLKNFENDSGSILNQRKLLSDYIKSRPDLAEYEIMEFCDDGYSGTNFERPCVERMLALVKAKRVKCIIVKDFSRFGRNYILVGKYLEEIFPFLGVRFISVNDRFDSEFDDAVGALDVGFKNIMHDYYAKMTSAKLKQMKRFQAEQGTMKFFEFYGYVKDKNRNLVIDPEAAKVIRQIFKWRIEGVKGTEIARRLNDEGVPAPHPKESIYSQHWRANMVYHILHNEKYTGRCVFGKTENVNFKSVPTDESKWIVFEKAFEPIISKEKFELANPTKNKKKVPEYVNTHIFSKKIKCGGCGASMYRSKEGIYYCKTRLTTSVTNCPAARFDEMRIADIILKILNKYIDIYSKDGVKRITSNESKITIRKLCDDIQRINAEIMALYEEYVNGNISKAEHMNRREEIGQKKELLEMQLKQFETEENIIQEKQKLAYKLKSDSADGVLQELTPDIVNEFIDKIVVYDEDRIEIFWKFKDMFSDFVSI